MRTCCLTRDSTDENQHGVYSELWKLKIPSKASFYAWRLIQDRLPTKINLRRRNVEVICPFCRNNEEDATHLFFSCDKIMVLWWESMSWINMVGVFPQSPRHHFLQHSFCRLSGIWWISLTWCIWCHRNRIVFSNGTWFQIAVVGGIK